MAAIPEYFGENVFDDRAMKAALSPDVYNSLRKTIENGEELNLSVANMVAEAMKDWAVQKGATHYTHWFQPMTGMTAEKHDSFISPAPGGGVIMEFSGKELIKGEPDASSFPSGGLRATFEARGYTTWDPTSYAFLKGKTLCIPTAFCTYGGHALDKKTPLLRSMEAVNIQALRVLHLFGNENVTRVTPSVGPEQEYFLVDKNVFYRRKDLVYTGRTLFGRKPPKGQEMDDHYFGALKPRVAAFMEDLNVELWKLGIYSKTEHNEVAPAQHELAEIYTQANIATDHNQLTMEMMQHIAAKHDMICLLHEKPFAGVNGSGKHNNWSLSTNTGINLLSPGETPYDNAMFLLFLMAVVQAVDNYQDLLRISVATATNDLRLGGNEAPPAVVSVFLGDELTAILDAIEHDSPYNGVEKNTLKLGVAALPRFPQDSTDRNRTSPFAFTGNKFEFRMLGSANSLGCVNIMLNSAVADSLRSFADRLESEKQAGRDLNEALHALIQAVIRDHKRIIFNGNGYDEAWMEEATKKRGLLNYRTTPDCLPHLVDEKNVRMLTSLGVFSREELQSRFEIQTENYVKTEIIEANTMTEMARKDILPAVRRYAADIASALAARKQLEAGFESRYEAELLKKLTRLLDLIDERTARLESLMVQLHLIGDYKDQSFFIRDEILPAMALLRAAVDDAENETARNYWPYPTYGDLMFSVH